MAVSIDTTTRAGYYPDAAPIRVRVVAERGTGRLLGAQIVGEEGAAKRIDVLAAAIWNDMTVDDVASMEQLCDRWKGCKSLIVADGKFRLE